MIKRAFIDGSPTLHQQPAAAEWTQGLATSCWDMLIPCANPTCTHHAYMLADPSSVCCPFCGTPYPLSTLPVLKLRSERQPGLWLPDSYLAAFHSQSLFPWHVFDNIPLDEPADSSPQACCMFHQGRWLLINQAMDSLTASNGNRIPIGSTVELQDKVQLRLSQQPHGRIAEVQLLQVSTGTQTLSASPPAFQSAGQTITPPATQLSNLSSAAQSSPITMPTPPLQTLAAPAMISAPIPNPYHPHPLETPTNPPPPSGRLQEKLKTSASLIIAFGSLTTAIIALLNQCHR